MKYNVHSIVINVCALGGGVSETQLLFKHAG